MVINAVLVLWMSFGAAARAQSTGTLMGVDVYRSKILTVDAARKAAGPLLANYVALRNTGYKHSDAMIRKVRSDIERRIAATVPLAFVKVYYGEYFSKSQHSIYITLDVVDKGDVKVRMPFRQAPKRHLPDPGGLLASWQEYSDYGMSLVRDGTLMADRRDCPAFYCLWGSATPELAERERRFVEGAAPNKAALLRVIKYEADANKRAAALYVVSYSSDGKEISDLMAGALSDPSEDVRAAALQVLADIALYHPLVLIDVPRIVPVLDYPTSSDRSKALALMIALVGNPAYRPYLVSRAGRSLVRLLKMSQPTHHDLAYTLLALLSNKDYGQHDYEVWEQWAQWQESGVKKR